MSASKSQRTEQPTGKKLSDARKKGNVPRTKELSNVFVLGAFVIFGNLFGSDWLHEVRALIVFTFSNLAVDDIGAGQWISISRSLIETTARLILLPVGFMAVAGLAGNLVQGPPAATLHPFKPDLSKINPLKGIKKVFSQRSLVQLLKALLNLVLFSIIAVSAVRDAIDEGLPGAPGVEGTIAALFLIINKVMVRIVGLWLVIAFIDLLWTRYEYSKNLRMTKQEVKDERKQHEGDPRVKGRIRSKQMEMARTRMMAEVPNATLVVTNPTHYAVAMRYVPGEMDVPVVVAMGRGKVAQKIREIAAQHRIPIIQDPPLARALFRLATVGSLIPVAMYRAVAETLALVLRPGDRRRARTTVTPGAHP